MTYLKTISFFLALIVAEYAAAQINPPDLQCVRSDTLFWSPAINSCGSFISTDIYHSSTLAGPYTVIATITDETVTSFHHPVSGNAFYFLQSNNDCPGLTALPSDTINNLAPAATILERVSIQADGVLVSWYDNNDPKTVGHIIYRSTPQGTQPIDTVYGVQQYLDVGASQEAKSESYYVLAIDACGNTGLFDNAHNTIHLTATLDFCRQHIQLNWNPYGVWQNGNESVQIWLGLDGAPAVFEHQVQLTDTLAYLTGIRDNRQYCITIVYKEQGRNVTSSSNTICLASDVINPLAELTIRNVSVQNDGSIEISWNHTAEADLDNLQINRGDDQINQPLLQDLIGQRPVSDLSTYEDRTANSATQPYFYHFEAIDACDTMSESSPMSSIFLHAEARSATENEITWSQFFAPNREIIDIQLCRIDEGGNEQSISAFTANIFNYTDLVESPAGGTICYRIKARHTNLMGTDTLIASSNTVCLEQKINLYIPNAFVPTGLNSIFKPEFVSTDGIASYQMQIFNRWGGKVYQSSVIGDGWDGRQDGRTLSAGVYFYIITFQQPDGKLDKRAGTINLIR
jgi:gliding motility-associated-like protein